MGDMPIGFDYSKLNCKTNKKACALAQKAGYSADATENIVEDYCLDSSNKKTYFDLIFALIKTKPEENVFVKEIEKINMAYINKIKML